MSQNNPLGNNGVSLSFKTTEQAISMACADGGEQIAAIRTDLAAWSAGKPKAVQNAVANLIGWLDVAADYPGGWMPRPGCPDGIDVLACTARAVETLRSAVRDSART